ncbi:hypothetical protein KSP40_PGU002074 [Platanthera guangdongensis]|uniref:EF hand associated type-2 domain-containing protein n=1 Tax=Platanthera guangdongensis TaxID=2320717 RepID=A0ABR2MZF2_9ASPA
MSCGVNKNGLNWMKFIFLHYLFILKGRIETTLTINLYFLLQQLHKKYVTSDH